MRTIRVDRRLSIAPAALALMVALAGSAGLAGSAAARQQPPPRTSVTELVSLTGEVTAVDLANRSIVLRGPLGGEVVGKVSPDVKNLAQVKVGDLLTISYQQSIAVSATRKGESNPLFTGGDSASAAPGEKPSLSISSQTKKTVKVLAVDPKAKTLTVEGADGKTFSTVVKRPEFIQKLEQLRPGDQLDVVTTDAYVVEVTPAAPGAKPSMSYSMSTLIIDSGEIVQRSGSTIIVRNEQGRRIKVAVDPDFKFKLDGKDATVFDLKPGMKLNRTALRVVENVSYEG